MTSDARVLVLSYNDESWVELDELREICAVRGAVEVLELRLEALRRARRSGSTIRAASASGPCPTCATASTSLIVGERSEVERLAAAAREEVPHG